MLWTPAMLMNYMKNPRQAVKTNSGTQMNFAGLYDYQTRVNIIHYLLTLDWTNEAVTEACGVQRRVLDFCCFAMRKFLTQSFWVPNALQ